MKIIAWQVCRGAVEPFARQTGDGPKRFSLDADLRKWLPGQSIGINQTVTLPSGMESGNYSLLPALPDASSSIANRPEYSIQMANANTWESNTGFNKLNATVSVAP